MKEIGVIETNHDFKYGDHDITSLETADAETLKIIHYIKCSHCRNYTRTSISFKLNTLEFRIKILNALYESFKNSVVESCEEARLLGIIAHIHNT